MRAPSVEEFDKVVKASSGNLSRVADHFKVSRFVVYKWMEKNPKLKQSLENARMRLFDECLTVARTVSLGIPIFEGEGDKRTLVGWKDRPDGNMLRYLMSTLGRKEGFGESVDITSGGAPVQLVFGNTRLSDKDIEDIKKIQHGGQEVKDSADASIPEA